MKYKLKIVPQDGGYVGYALQNDEVIYTTSVHKDTIMASRELSKFVSNQDKPQTISPVPFQRANSALPIPSSTVRSNSRPVTNTKCCGRG